MAKLFRVSDLQRWDAETIRNQSITSVALMERAATACADVLCKAHFNARSFTVCCGTGNNGGDGLAIARLLLERGLLVDRVFIVGDPELGSNDFKVNLNRLKALPVSLTTLTEPPTDFTCDICIDALFGTGLNRPVSDHWVRWINAINAQSGFIISIDLPSGYPADGPFERDFTAVDADWVLTFQQWKRSFFFPLKASLQRNRRIEVIDIGLCERFAHQTPAEAFTFGAAEAQKLLHERHRFSHKGSFGSALIVAGSKGMMGAAVLAVKAALRSGCGLTFAHTPECGTDLIQMTAPEAIALVDESMDAVSKVSVPTKITAIGIGPGISTAASVINAMHDAIDSKLPLVIDADGLNLLATNHDLLDAIAQHRRCVLTPHPAEFDRLFGEHPSMEARIQTAQKEAQRLNAVIHLKGAFSVTILPAGSVHFHTSGSAALAVGGSGDVLTGIITGLLAQGLSEGDAALLGACVHGTAGEAYQQAFSTIGLTAGCLIDYLPVSITRLLNG